MAHGLPHVYVEGQGPCTWSFAFCLQDLTSWAHLPFARSLCACVQEPLSFTDCFGWSQDIREHVAFPFQKFLRERKKVSFPAFHIILLNVVSCFYWKSRWGSCLMCRTVVFLVHLQPKKGVGLFKGNRSNKVPKSLEAETSAGTMSRLLAEFSSVK